MDGRGRRLLALTCATGLVDAVAFLALGQVFCAMQTGNVVFLGLGVAGEGGAPVAAPLTALCAFVAGGVAAALLMRDRSAADGGAAEPVADAAPGGGAAGAVPDGAPAGGTVGAAGTATAAVAMEIALLALATVAAAALEPRAGETAALLTIAALAAAMGLRTTVVRGRGAANLATTVLNLTVIGGAAGAGAGLASGADLAQRAAALLALLLGAIAGALLLDVALWIPLALATSLTLVTHALDRPAAAATA